jgi:hypothetical protein
VDLPTFNRSCRLRPSAERCFAILPLPPHLKYNLLPLRRPSQSQTILTTKMEPASNTDEGFCVACAKTLAMDDEDWWGASCGHDFCWTCIEALLRSSLSGGPFPPKCCQQDISIYEDKRVQQVLSEDLYDKLKDRREELQASDRTYCSIPTCSHFIRAVHISNNDATCPACGGITCVACKAATLTGKCPADEALQQLLSIAEVEGWRRCGRCLNMIERIDGCDDML